jgi:plasmid maintenance system antidote protein VapI
VKGKDLRKILERLEISQRAAAKYIGINERTMRRYIAGDLEIPRAIELAVKWLELYVSNGNEISA